MANPTSTYITLQVSVRVDTTISSLGESHVVHSAEAVTAFENRLLGYVEDLKNCSHSVVQDTGRNLKLSRRAVSRDGAVICSISGERKTYTSIEAIESDY